MSVQGQIISTKACPRAPAKIATPDNLSPPRPRRETANPAAWEISQPLAPPDSGCLQNSPPDGPSLWDVKEMLVGTLSRVKLPQTSGDVGWFSPAPAPLGPDLSHIWPESGHMWPEPPQTRIDQIELAIGQTQLAIGQIPDSGPDVSMGVILPGVSRIWPSSTDVGLGIVQILLGVDRSWPNSAEFGPMSATSASSHSACHSRPRDAAER